MPNNHTVTNSITQEGTSHAVQTITPDYTGIYALCGTVFIISMITLAVINRISEKWRIDHYKIEQLKVTKSCEQNIILLRKLDKVLDVLNNEVEDNGTCG